MAQVFSDLPRIDAARCCSYNGFLGLLILGGAFALRLSGPSDPLGGLGFALAVVSAVILIAGLVVPLARPLLIPTLLAVQGVVIVLVTLGFGLACAAWALGIRETHGFHYLPGLVVVGSTYGVALWADFGPPRERPRPWRLAGFLAGIVLEGAVAVLLAASLLRS